MESFRSEIHTHTPKLMPEEQLVKNLAGQTERQKSYNLPDFKNILAGWRSQIEQQENPEIKNANLALINTVESLVEYAVACSWEQKQPQSNWRPINKIKAAHAAHNTMFTADALSSYPPLLQKFWHDIFTPLAASGGLSDYEINGWQIGLMAELAVGKALDKIFAILKKDNLKIYKTTPQEDVKNQRDLVISSQDSSLPDNYLQIKVTKGGGDTFVSWVDGQQPTLFMYYNKNINELFNPYTGQPSNALLREIVRVLPERFKKAN